VLLWATGSADTTAGNNDEHFSGSREERAAEILATSENQQTISTTSTVLTESFNETITSTTGTTESSFVNSTDGVTSPPTSTTSEATTTQSGNVTTTLLPPPANTTNTVPQHDADYPADYHNIVTSSTDDMLDEITTTTDKSPVTHVKVELSTITTPREISTEATLVSATTTEETSHLNASMSRTSGQQLLTAVGRALSQEESVPWPEAKSTKVIGTIIEDIQSPFSSSNSDVSARNEALNNGSITAIVLCTFVILLTTFGNNHYYFVERFISELTHFYFIFASRRCERVLVVPSALPGESSRNAE